MAAKKIIPTPKKKNPWRNHRKGEMWMDYENKAKKGKPNKQI